MKIPLWRSWPAHCGKHVGIAAGGSGGNTVPDGAIGTAVVGDPVGVGVGVTEWIESLGVVSVSSVPLVAIVDETEGGATM